MKKQSDQLQEETKLLGDRFEKAGVDIIIIANYGEGKGGCRYDYKGDGKTMLTALLFEAARNDEKFKEAIKLAALTINGIELGLLEIPSHEAL